MLQNIGQQLFLTYVLENNGRLYRVRTNREVHENRDCGKVLWYQRFRPKIYGATALKHKLQREIEQ